jgi:hypothetical protein
VVYPGSPAVPVKIYDLVLEGYRCRVAGTWLPSVEGLKIMENRTLQVSLEAS